MAKVVADISVSLDGYVTGPDPGPQQGLGRDDGAAPRDLRQIHVRPSGHATHLTYRVD